MRGHAAVIEQLGEPQDAEQDSIAAARLGFTLDGTHSGGERTKTLIAAAFARQPDLLLADEPTTNLDINGIEKLEHMLRAFRGGVLLISHDMMLLTNVCNKVLDLDGGVFTLYNCGFEDYLAQKEREKAAHLAQYNAYAAERQRLAHVAADKAKQSANVRKTPTRMGNSEARLHRMGGQKQKEKLDRAAKAAKSRLEQLEKVDKPWRQKPLVFDIRPGALHNPVLVSADGVTKKYGERVILDNCRFVIPNGKKTALIGPNGAGKTTLLNMIAGRSEGVAACAGLKIGYYRQDTGGLKDSESLLGNAMAHAVYGETFVRTILARLLFRRDELHHPAGVLSGGERLKLALACVILSDFNLLLLDEPTNFLDIASRQALTDVLAAYPGAVLVASHDRAFISAVCDRVISLDTRETTTFEGGYSAYMAWRRG
jgi:macrolide transport system ATP-binding/permease protein